ncbi:KTSC domain-containing protein [Providencia alcalifaciens]
MHRSHINSPTVHSISYDHSTKTLNISYHHKGTYQYMGVPNIVYQRLITSYTPQKYIDRNIINKYESVKID